MLYCLYKSAPDVLRDVALPGSLLFGKKNTTLAGSALEIKLFFLEIKFIVILCDAPAGHVCRIIRSKAMYLPEEPDEIYN